MKRMIKYLAVTVSILLLFSMTGCNLIIEEEVVTTRTKATTTAEGSPDSSGDPTAPTGDGTTAGDGQETTAVTTTRTTAKTRTEPKLSGKLELQIFTNESQTAYGGWTNVLNAFEDATGIQVTAHIGSDANTKLSNRWKKGNPPDVVWIDGSGIPDIVYESTGKFYDLTELYQTGYVYGTDSKIKDVLDANLIHRTNDRVYRLPALMTSNGVWYDSRFLQQKGLSVPSNYEELLSVAAQAKSMGLSTYTYPGQYPSYCLSAFIAPAVAAYGQEYFDQWLSGSKAALQDERFVDILTRYAAFCRTSGYLMNSTTTADHTTVQSQWINHKTLLIANGLWLPDETRKLWTQQTFDMTWAPSPLITADQKPTVTLSGRCVAVAAEGKNVENALAFVRFVMREECQNWLMYSFGYMSPRVDMPFDTEKFLKESGGSDPNKATATALEYMNSSRVNRVYWNESWGTLGDEIATQLNELAMSDGKSVDEAIAYLVSKAPKA